jgi:FkbM family methyltransferase
MKNPNALINSDYGPIIININDSIIGKYISQTGFWASEDLILIKELIDFILLKKDKIMFYDVGSNIGTHSLALSKIYNEKISIRAFEAQRVIFNMMCGTFALNGLNNIFCHNLAVSNTTSDIIEFQTPDYNFENNFGGLEIISPNFSDNQLMKKLELEKISTVTLDSFNECVDFIKIDIEGMEDKALLGAKLILLKYRPICFIEIFKTNSNSLINTLVESSYCGFKKNNDLIALPNEFGLGINGLERLF